MGRPLKIAKAQAVVTITATDGTNEIVTTNANFTTLGIIAGMSFIPASSVGNLAAGTMYWILEVLNAGNNSTFTVSETQLSANPTYTKFNLGTAGPVTVAATVNVVDAYFNNPLGGAGYPATNANTYGVVGGNTAIYGSQVLAAAAIGRQGSGNVYSLTSSADVWGINSDFANTAGLAAGSAIEITNPLTGATTNLGFVGSLYRFDANVTDTYANGYIATDDNTGFNSDKPVYLQGNIGGLVANTPYFVTTIDGGGSLITLSTQPSGPNVALTAASGTVPVVAEAMTLTTNATANSGEPGVGYFSTYVYANDEAAFIVRQKGKTKYLVTGATTGLTAQCYTTNLANTALTPNTMTILATYDDASTAYVQSLNDYNSEVFPTTVAAGAFTPGVTYTIETVGTTDFTLVGAFTNMTGVTFTATGAGSGTGTVILSNANPDVIASFNSAIAANAAASLPPVVTITNA